MRDLDIQQPIPELVRKIAERAEQRGVTIAVAESCSGGGVAQALTHYPGISRVFRGGVVAYHNEVKCALLLVPKHYLKTYGAVSREVAEAMALGAIQQLSSTYAVSVTGIAGPSGGSETKPVGTVMFAVAGPGFAESSQYLFAGNREQVQAQSISTALALLLKKLM